MLGPVGTRQEIGALPPEADLALASCSASVARARSSAVSGSGPDAHACDSNIAIEPLCESATNALLRACPAEGNRAEALRQFHRFRHMLADETGLRPSPQLMDLMGGTLSGAKNGV